MTSCVLRRDTRTRPASTSSQPRTSDHGTILWNASTVSTTRTAAQTPKSSGTRGPIPTGADAAHRATAPVRLTLPSSARTARSSRKSSWRLNSSTAAWRARTSSMAAAARQPRGERRLARLGSSAVDQLEQRGWPEQIQVARVRMVVEKARTVHPGPRPSTLEPRETTFVQPAGTLRALRAIQHLGVHHEQRAERERRNERPRRREHGSGEAEPRHGHEDARHAAAADWK